MFDSQFKSTGTQYTLTVALLLVAFVICPLVLVASRPIGYFSISIAVAGSILAVAMAWVDWNWYSELTIPSIEARRPGSK